MLVDNKLVAPEYIRAQHSIISFMLIISLIVLLTFNDELYFLRGPFYSFAFKSEFVPSTVFFLQVADENAALRSQTWLWIPGGRWRASIFHSRCIVSTDSIWGIRWTINDRGSEILIILIPFCIFHPKPVGILINNRRCDRAFEFSTGALCSSQGTLFYGEVVLRGKIWWRRKPDSFFFLDCMKNELWKKKCNVW